LSDLIAKLCKFFKKRNSASGDNNMSGRLAAVERALEQLVVQENKTKRLPHETSIF
jgi:hypothetical protein